MIHFVKGKLCELERDRAVIECGYVGYSVMITAIDYEKLCQMGAFGADGECVGIDVKLYTFVKLVEESRFEVFGFLEKSELAMFGLLQTVSGIGTRAAMAVLSVLTVEGLCAAIQSDNTKAISAAQGVGSKASQKICIDLKTKLDKFMSENAVGAAATFGKQQANIEESLGDNQKLAVEALVNLGYSRAQANKAVKGAGSGSVEEIIRRALSGLL